MAHPLRVLGCFSGIGGLETGACAGLRRVGRTHRAVAYIEREAFSVACLVSSMEEGRLAPAPVWGGDIRTFPAGDVEGLVDLVVGGFPCQDLSSAGKGAGLGAGTRSGLFFDLERLARRVGARYLFMENVSGLRTKGPLSVVVEALLRGGWDAEWLGIRASYVGAPHRRERWFCLAYRGGDRRDEGAEVSQGRQPEPAVSRKELADGDGQGCCERSKLYSLGRQGVARARRDNSLRRDPELADASRQLRDRIGNVGTQGRPESTDSGRQHLPAWPPRPDDIEGWRRVLTVRPDLAPALDTGRAVDDADSRRHGQQDEAVRAERNGSQRAGDVADGGREERDAPAQSEIRRVAHGLPGMPHGTVLGCATGSKQGSGAEGSAASDESCSVRSVREDERKVGATSPGLQPPARCDDPLPTVSSQARPGGGEDPQETAAPLRGVRAEVHPFTLDEQHEGVREGVPPNTRTHERGEAVGGPPQGEGVPRLRGDVRVRARTGANMQSEVRGHTRVEIEKALLHRTDRLRALGNAVVPAQAAAAFAELWRRVHDD